MKSIWTFPAQFDATPAQLAAAANAQIMDMKWTDLPEGYCSEYANPATPCDQSPKGRDYFGGDLKGAIGNMFGPVVGDSYGLGGLGLKGSGTGGGGQGETIGIGAVGTKGRGGGLGGYGTGVGGLGRKSDRDVAVDTQNVKILGAIDPELIRKVIREHASEVRYCYEQELVVNPKLEGKVAIQWQIGSEGHASGCVIHSDTTLLNDNVQKCIMSRIVTWQFPKPKGGGIAVITYPWILRASGNTE